MFEKDYIMRMIHQFVEFIIRIISDVRRGNTNQARIGIEAAAERFLGMRFELILGLGNQGLIDLLSAGGELNVEKAYVAAQLLFCEASARDEDGRKDSAALYIRALELFLISLPKMDGVLDTDDAPGIDRILAALWDQPLPPEISRLLIPYYEQRGEFSKAEDCLFEIVDGGLENALQIGEALYGRLSKRTDRELARGNLPRSEVEEGLRELRAKYKG